MYSLLAFSMLMALWMAIRGNWYLFFLFGAIAAYTQNVGLIYVTLIGLSAIAISKPIERAKGAISLALVLLAWSPWAVVVLQQVSALQSGGFWVPPLTVAGTFWPYILNSVGWRLPDVAQVHVYVAFTGLTLVGLLAARWWAFSRGGFLVLVALLIVPLAFAIFSATILNVYVFRALLPSGMLLAVVWGYALNHLSLYNRRVAWAICGPMLALALVCYYGPGNNSRDDIASWVEPARATDDPVYYLNATDEVQYSWYLPNPAYVMPSPGNMISITQPVRDAFRMEQRAINAVPGQAIWIIFTQSPFSSADKLAYWRNLLQQPGIQLVKARKSKLVATYLLRLTR
jgi:hypothetical protein